MTGAIDQFHDAIRAAGLTPPEHIKADGELHRFASNGKRSDDAGWYALHGDGIAAGAFGDWRSGFSQTWRADIGRTMTDAEQAAHRARVDAMRREREADDARRKAETAAIAAQVWNAAKPAGPEHPYLRRKGIKPHGARVAGDGRLVIPLRAEGALHSLQFIDDDGNKRFLSGGRVAGCYYSIGTTKGAAALCIAEGFATAASIHEATGHPVAAAMNCGNLEPVALALRAKVPQLPLILCADDDAATDGNPGLTRATATARTVGGLVAVPDFSADRPEGATDFNDLARHRGAEAVARAVANAATPKVQPEAGDATAADSDGWPEPQALAAKVAAEPYPIDALPAIIRAAVGEVAAFVKAPAPLVASSAFAALSLAGQAHIDVRRAERLQAPCGLFLLTIADSGERKSTCDGFFLSAITQFEAEQAEAAKPDVKRHAAEFAAWAAQREGILQAIKQAGKTAKPVDRLRVELAQLETDKPAPPRVPRLLYADATPEALAWGLAHGWPSGGVVSAEAGLVFGSHAMGRDSIMRHLAMLNQLWDGNTVHVDRRTTESFVVRGARLTVALQVQEPTLRSFFDRSGGLARGSGFLARFLTSWPESTQGNRPFTEAPPSWPHLAAFHQRIAAILANPAPINEAGALTPPALTLAPEAKSAWVAFYDAIESELASGGELFDVRDVASKTADNAARLAALFQIFEHGMGGAVGLECFEAASRIAAWHLNEARRFFGELALPAELANAARLDDWLIAYCQRERTHLVPIAKLQQGGPGGLRSKATIEAAVRELDEAGRARLRHDGRRKWIAVNPALLDGGDA